MKEWNQSLLRIINVNRNVQYHPSEEDGTKSKESKGRNKSSSHSPEIKKERRKDRFFQKLEDYLLAKDVLPTEREKRARKEKKKEAEKEEESGKDMCSLSPHFFSFSFSLIFF
ncbi:hypothetical protein H1C71_000348 [Ictidomys tridecemlineatus]|nr:hypothetical protein H1C71_000348 [Ictidomys tridecemlineatus]